MVSEDLSQRLRRMASPEWVEKPARDLLLEAADALDASVHAGSYRQELLLEIADSFRSAPDVLECEDMALFAMETRARIRREVIEEMAAWLVERERQERAFGHSVAGLALRTARECLLREFVEVPDGQ